MREYGGKIVRASELATQLVSIDLNNAPRRVIFAHGKERSPGPVYQTFRTGNKRVLESAGSLRGRGTFRGGQAGSPPHLARPLRSEPAKFDGYPPPRRRARRTLGQRTEPHL